MEKQKKQEIQVKVPDEVLKGVYSNFMRISHNKEEFILDFANIIPPVGIATARIIVSPGHLKRILKALEENFKLYEKTFGSVKEAESPKEGMGFQPYA